MCEHCVFKTCGTITWHTSAETDEGLSEVASPSGLFGKHTLDVLCWWTVEPACCTCMSKIPKEISSSVMVAISWLKGATIVSL